MSGCRIFIGRLNPSAREKDVERFFKGFGRIRDIDLKRGFGFVVSHLALYYMHECPVHAKCLFNGLISPSFQEFDDPRDAEDAVYELDGKELCNER